MFYLLSTRHHQVCEPHFWLPLSSSPACFAIRGIAVRVPMRVHNVTALQHDVDKISSLFLLDACKSTSVKSVHKHFSEISAL